MLSRKGAAHHGLWELEFLLPRRHRVVVDKRQPQPPLRLQLAQVTSEVELVGVNIADFPDGACHAHRASSL